MRTRIDQTEQGGRTIFTLVDDASGASASVLPSYGFNLFDLRLPAAGEARRVIVANDSFAATPERPARNGWPILFPFPGRVREGRYSFEGQDYQLRIDPSKGHAIHGFALDAAWDVVASGSDERGAFVEGRFQISRHAPDRLDSWPSDAALTVRYELLGRRLTMISTVENPTADRRLPFGLGIHPYFRLPFGRDPARGRMVLPAAERWPTEGSLPTGERVPVDSRVDFRAGASTVGRHLDEILTGLTFENDQCTCRLVDENLGCTTRIAFDAGFRELVVFVPPHDDALVAVEPYTMTPDAPNLEAQGVDAGLRVLGPGESSVFRIEVQTED